MNQTKTSRRKPKNQRFFSDKNLDLTNIVCPLCHALLDQNTIGRVSCDSCRLIFPKFAGFIDLRLHSDRYLSLNQERRKAERLSAKEHDHSLEDLARAYYAITADVDNTRRERFVRHISGAHHRGQAMLARLPKKGNILEIGCGTGGFLAAAAEAGRNAIGIDIASRWLVVARRRLQELLKYNQSCPLIPACAEKVPFANESFDIVVADSLLEHVDDTFSSISEMLRVARPGGLIMIWAPNPRWPGPDPHVGLWLVKFMPKKSAVRYLKWRRGDIFWPTCRTSQEWAELIRRHFTDCEIKIQSADTSHWPVQDKSLRGRIARTSGRLSHLPIFHLLFNLFGPLIEIQITKTKKETDSDERSFL